MGDDDLLDAEAEVAACRRARARAEVLATELAAEQRVVQRLRKRLDDEHADVRKLQGGSLTSVVARLRGRRDDALSTERAEAAAVEAELAAHVQAMQRLSARFTEARDESHRLPDAEARLAAAVEAREREIAAGGDARAAELRALDRELAAYRTARDRLRAVRHAALKADAALEYAVERLGTAEGWSVADVLSDGSGGFRHGSSRFGGDIAGRAKHGALDESIVPIAEAHASLLQLRAELNDIGMGDDDVHRPNVRMPSSRLGAWDIWFDNEFSDLMVHDRISSSITQLERSARSVQALLADLDPQHDTVSGHVERLEARRAELLRSP